MVYLVLCLQFHELGLGPGPGPGLGLGLGWVYLETNCLSVLSFCVWERRLMSVNAVSSNCAASPHASHLV